MNMSLGRLFAIDGNFMRVGDFEMSLVPRPHAAIACAQQFALHRIGRHTFVFLGPRVLTIRQSR
jgi:hypothetical protein